MDKKNVLICGATGYIGLQLTKLLCKHKNINIKYLCGSTSVGKKIDKHAVRNPFLKSTKFNDIEIYEFDYKKLPFCINDKKSEYSK